MTTETIELRAATAADIPVITELRRLFSEELAGKQEPSLEQSMREGLTQYLESELNKTCICWLALNETKAVSVMLMVLRHQPGSLKNPSGKWGYLMNVYTIPEYRKRGIAARLLQHIVDHTRSLGYAAIELHATSAGIPLYESGGFSVHPEPTYRSYPDIR